MGKLKRAFSLLVFMMTAAFSFAKGISIQVVQHGSKSDKIFDQSFVLEDEILNGFFETGFIVTNSPAIVSYSAADDMQIWNMSLGDAYEGSSDFYAQIDVFYNPDEIMNSGKLRMEKIGWSVASVKNGKKIGEDSITINKKMMDDKDLKKLSLNLISEIYSVIQSNKA